VAEETKESAAPAPAASGSSSGGSKFGLPVIVGLLNTLVLLGALGTAAYTLLMFKRPEITEEQERAKLEALRASPSPAPSTGYIEVPAFSVNIRSTPAQPGSIGYDPQIAGKLHYVSLGFSLEMKHMDVADDFEVIKPMFMDRLLQLLGKKEFNELTTVQGRYLVRNEIMELANELLKQAVVLNVFFTKFVVQ
jgi:flagellar FliL protein